MDLGKRGVLFAVLDADDYKYLFSAFQNSPPGFTPEGIKFFKETRKKGVLSIDTYPMLVWFKDIKDPKTVQLVYETESYETPSPKGGFSHHKRLVANHMEEFFGEGVKLRNITIEITQENIDWRVARWLQWLSEYKIGMLDGERYNTLGAKYPVANSLSAESFSTGEYNNE